MTIEHGPLRQRARGLIDQVDAAPRETLEEATGLLEGLGASGDAEASSMLERVRGTSMRLLGELPDAERALLDAVDHAARAGSALLEGEARMSLGVVLAFVGRPDEAMASFDRAESLLDGVEAARVVFQRSSILYRQGEYADALELMDRALPHFEAAGDVRHAAHTRSNRGVVLGYAGRLEEARSDLRRADELYRSIGLQSAAAVATHNLGWVAGRLGELALALQLYDQAAEELTLLGRPHPELAIDRCEVLIAAGCPEEAAPIASGAAVLLREGGNTLEGAEALLMSAAALLWCEEPAAAEHAAVGAMQLFSDNGRPLWATAAEALAFDARWKEGRVGAEDVAAIESIGGLLESGGQHLASREALLLAGRIALAHEDLDTGTRLLSRVSDARLSGPIDTRIQAWLSLALLRRASGDSQGASRAALAGANALVEAQGALGALDLRSTMASHGDGIFAIGTELAMQSGRARRVFDWAERSRAGSLRFPPVLPPDDPQSAEELTQLRLASIKVRELESSGQPSATAKAELKRREDAVVSRNRQAARSGGVEDAIALRSAGEIRAALSERVLLEFFVHENVRYVLRLDQSRCRLISLGDPDEHTEAVERLERRLRRLAVRGGRSSDSLEAAVETAIAELADSIFLSASPDDDVVVVPSPDLASVPWSLLAEHSDARVTVSPSASLWAETSGREAVSRESPRVLVVRAPGVDADGRELELVSAAHGRVSVLDAGTATTSDVVEALSGVDIAHVIAHGSASRQNPLFASLEMADGPLYAYDLQRVRHPPKLMVLSSCNAGVSMRMSRSESLGMASVLLAGGTRNVVATTSLLPDTIDTAESMGRFHSFIAAGESVRSALASSSPDSRAVSLECFGAG